MFEVYQNLVESIDIKDNYKEVLYAALIVHGHVCGGIAMGFAAGLCGLKALNIERERDLGTHIIALSGFHHIASCFVDGLQVSTGCTFGKRLIEKKPMGKWSFTMSHIKTHSAIKITVKPEVIMSALGSSYVRDYRSQGIQASDIPTEISYPLFQKVFSLYNTNALVDAEGPFEYISQEEKITFNYEICDICHNAVAQNYIMAEGSKKVCMECAQYI